MQIIPSILESWNFFGNCQKLFNFLLITYPLELTFGFVFPFVEYLYTPDENTVKNDRAKFIYGPNHMYVENLNQKAATT